METHDETSKVAELKLDDDVGDPRSEAENRVHHEHQHDFIEEFYSAPARFLVHPAANNDDLRYDLARHQ